MDKHGNPNKLEQKAKGRKEGKRGRFLTQLDMAIIKHDAAHQPRTGHDIISICGCGMEGCAIHTSVGRGER